MTSGEWRVASGEWRVASGELEKASKLMLIISSLIEEKDLT